MPSTLAFRLATLIAVEVWTLLGATSDDANTGIPYFTPVVVGVSVLGILSLYRLTQRTLVREQGARIKVLGDDVKTERERCTALQVELATERRRGERLDRDVDELRFDNSVCEWRVTMLVRLMERLGVEVPPEVQKPARLYRAEGGVPPDEPA